MMQSSGEIRRENEKAWRWCFRGPSFETPLSRLLRMRSSDVARSQTLMVRRRASAVSNHAGRDAASTSARRCRLLKAILQSRKAALS